MLCTNNKKVTQADKTNQITSATWQVRNKNTIHYYSSSCNKVFQLYQGSFNIYCNILGRVTWFHITTSSCTELPSDAEFCTVQKFGSTIYCKAPLQHAVSLQEGLTTISDDTQTFDTFLAQQPQHVQRLLGNLCAEDMDVDYWTDAINSGEAMIATDGS
eukprot:6360773-Ditylum_brightwellii.AAC.1